MLVGYPIAEVEVFKNGETLWINQNALAPYISEGYLSTGNKRMGYAPPAWIAGKTGGGILLIDDYSRTHPHILQAVMEIK